MVNESNSVQQPTFDDSVSDLVDALLEDSARHILPAIIHASLNAARYDDLDDVVSLYSLGVSLDAKDSQGRTALHMAAANGHVDIVEYLIRNGVDVNASNNEKNTPLHWACLNGKKEVVKALILAGATVSLLNSYERTPMDEAVARGDLQIVDAVNAAVAQAELQGISVSSYSDSMLR